MKVACELHKCRGMREALVAMRAGLPLFRFQESKNCRLPACERLPGGEGAPRRSQGGHDGLGGENAIPLRLGDEGAEAEMAELSEKNRAFDWGRERQSQADAGT